MSQPRGSFDGLFLKIRTLRAVLPQISTFGGRGEENRGFGSFFRETQGVCFSVKCTSPEQQLTVWSGKYLLPFHNKYRN